MKSCLNHKNFFVLLLCAAMLCLAAGLANGKTITVRADGSGDYPTIQAAIDHANDGDEIVCADGTYTGDGNRDIDFLGKAIAVRSESGPGNCVINCEGAGRGFMFPHGEEDANSVVDGFSIFSSDWQAIQCERGSSPTIANCVISGNNGESAILCRYGSPTITNCIVSNNTGIGILCIHSSPTINNCTITDNTNSDFGGGGIICTRGSSPSIINCTITGNKAEDLGGGIYCEESSLTITNSTISGNSNVSNSYTGSGGICCKDGNLTIKNCSIAGNSSEGKWATGGGISCIDGNLIITNCTIASNSSEGEWASGGIFCFGGSPTISNCTIAGNSSEGGERASGGGIFCYGENAKITNCTITGNTAGRYGGGIYCGRNETISNCSITGNMANECGGGISVEGSKLTTLVNCTFAGNSAPNGNAVACNSYEQHYPSNLFIMNSILWDGGNEVWNNDDSRITITFSDIENGCLGLGNINADPYFIEPGHKDPNGVWIEGDYHLSEDSPCIDAGDPNYVSEPNETDLDGNPRVFGVRIDMGAYEFYPNTVPNACIVGGDRTVEVVSGCEARVILDGSCSSDADSTPGTNDDINDFDWYEVIDPCDPNSDIYLGSGEIIECNLPLGEHTIVLEVTDKAGAFDVNEVAITVEDTTPPEFSLTVEPSVLWPVNHKMVEITPSWEVSDNCDEWPEVTLVGVTMNEDGGTEDDIQIGDDGIWLRAERSGTGSGRVYTITYQAVDDSGNVTQKSAAVTVPHDKSKSK